MSRVVALSVFSILSGIPPSGAASAVGRHGVKAVRHELPSYAKSTSLACETAASAFSLHFDDA